MLGLLVVGVVAFSSVVPINETNVMCSAGEESERASSCFVLVSCAHMYVRTRVWYAVSKEHQHHIREHSIRRNIMCESE